MHSWLSCYLWVVEQGRFGQLVPWSIRPRQLCQCCVLICNLQCSSVQMHCNTKPWRAIAAQQPSRLEQQPCVSLLLQGSPGPSSSSAAAAPGSSAAAGSNEDIEASIRQLELQGRPAGETDPCGNSGSGAGAAAAGSSAASSDTGVSQSRASSSIRVAKFHKVLNESLVRGSTRCLHQQPSFKLKHAQV
jgi:hypothetical protein